jgi:hypothetical protein
MSIFSFTGPSTRLSVGWAVGALSQALWLLIFCLTDLGFIEYVLGAALCIPIARYATFFLSKIAPHVLLRLRFADCCPLFVRSLFVGQSKRC